MRAQAIRRAKSGMLEDEELQQLITERLDEDPAFISGTGRNRTVVNVEVSDGHVTLTGLVRSALDRRRADLLVRALGASGVDNKLRVQDQPTNTDKSEKAEKAEKSEKSRRVAVA
jgi:osmotically-inducible protein OsmY